jgi:hypothetical protein
MFDRIKTDSSHLQSVPNCVLQHILFKVFQ